MRIALLWLLVVIPALASAGPVATHCRDGETTYFNCVIEKSKKIASVCGAGYDYKKNAAGYIQYRFGHVGKVEFIFPETTDQAAMKDRFFFESSRTADYVQWDTSLEFINGLYSYSLYYGEEHPEKGAVSYQSTVLVWKDKDRKHATVLNCLDPSGGKDLSGIADIIRKMSSSETGWNKSLW